MSDNIQQDIQQINDDLATQSSLLNDINNALMQRSSLIENTNNSIMNQSANISMLNNAITQANQNINTIGNNFSSINNTLSSINQQGISILNDNVFNQINNTVRNVTSTISDSVDNLDASTRNLSANVSEYSQSQSQLSDEMNQVARTTRTTAESVRAAALRQAAAMENATHASQGMEKEQGKVAKYMEKFGNRLKKIGKNLLRGMGQLAVAFANFTTSTMGSIFDLMKAFATIPFTITQAGAAVGNEIRQTLVEGIGQSVEDLKEKFDMTSYIGKTIVKMGRTASGLLKEFENPTSEMVAQFGHGAAGLSNIITQYGEMLESIGIYSEVFAGEINKNMKSFMFFIKLRKAAGYSAEDMKYLAMDANNKVMSLKDRMYSAYMTTRRIAKEYSLDAKTLSKNFMTLRKDIILFGNISDERLNKTAAYMEKMGLDMKEAAAVFNKFSTFEEASNSVAILSQTFGMNISALDLIKAQNPDEIFQILHDAMLATGKSFKDLSRFEKDIMQQQTGMSAEALQIMMNYRRQGLTFSEIRKKMAEDAPEKKQLRALKELRGAIKEIKKVLNFKSFTEALTKGLAQNLSLTGDTKDLLMALSEGYEGLYKYAANIPSSTIMKVMKPIHYIINIMKSIFESPTFITNVENVISLFGDILTMSFKPSKVEISQEIKNKINQDKQNNFANLQRLFVNLSTQILQNNNGGIPDLFVENTKATPGNLVKPFQSYNEADYLTVLTRIITMEKDKYLNFKKEVIDQLDKKDLDLLKSLLPLYLQQPAESLEQSALQIVEEGKNAFGKLGTVTAAISGALLRGAFIASTAIINTLTVMLRGKKVDGDTPDLIEILTTIDSKEFDTLYDEMMNAFQNLFVENGNLGGVGIALFAQVESFFTTVAYFLADILYTAVMATFSDFDYSKNKFSNSVSYQQYSGEFSPENLKNISQTKFEEPGQFQVKKYPTVSDSGLTQAQKENLILSASIINDLKNYVANNNKSLPADIKNLYPELDEFIKNPGEFGVLPGASLQDPHKTHAFYVNLIEQAGKLMDPKTRQQDIIDYRKNSSLPLVRELQENLDKSAKSNPSTGAPQPTPQVANVKDSKFPDFGAPESEFTLFGKDNRPIGINDLSNIAENNNTGILSYIINMTKNIADDATEINALTREKYDENKFTEKSNKRDAFIAKINELCSLVNDSTSKIKSEEVVYSKILIDNDEITKFTKKQLDPSVGLNKMTAMHEYNQGTFVNDLTLMGNTANNTGDYGAPRPNYYRGKKT